MEKLYGLYDYFTEQKESHDSSSLCRNISKIAEKYKSMMQEYKEKDHKLCEELTNLKDIIERDKLVAKNICTKNTSDLFYLKIDPPREEQKAVAAHAQRRISGEARPPKHISYSSPHAHGRPPVETRPPNPVSVSSTQAHGRPPGETHTPPLVTVPSSRAHDRNSVQTSTPTPLSEYSSQAKGLEKQSGGESERTSSVLPKRFPLPVPVVLSESTETEEETGPMGPYRISGQEPEPEPELELPQEQGRRIDTLTDSYYFEEDEGDQRAGSMQSTFDTGTIMGTIKDAVSNVFEAVEPVPVLGVSGGMGALYLLFKYTPIGSLFGRNRRNNQNIPNFFDPRYGEQFSGYYPQYYNEGFPNYRMNIAYHPSSEELD
ncbi:Plasmodium vivax Vir protein, putative [Plasmodium vivax]|nr:Plasmodium vivax Vir protein, putative [Plasmodium vivax]